MGSANEAGCSAPALKEGERMEPLQFVYRNAQDEVTVRKLSNWAEIGHYIKGYSVGDKRVLTFRKDRVVEYVSGIEALQFPFSSAPPRPQKSGSLATRPQVLFTGFAKVQRAVLEAKADAGGLQVCKTVTKDLSYLCAGPNAGPAKVEKARTQCVYILNEDQLHKLLETGELPEGDELDC